MAEAAKQGAAAPLPRTKGAMQHGWRVRAELHNLFTSFLERGGDPYRWCYAVAVTLDAVQAGRTRIVMMENGRPYRGRYYRTWAECTPQNILCEGKNRVALSLDEVPDAILRAAEAACKAAGKRRFHVFLKGSTIARMLGVTSAERKRLGLRLIGAIDTEAKMEAAERKRERDRRRDETKRREAGAKPRSEAAAEQARREGISPATLRKRKQRERERQAQHVTLSSPLNAGSNVTHSSPLHEDRNIIANQVDKEREMKHVTLSSPLNAGSNVTHSSPLHEDRNIIANQVDKEREMKHVTLSSPHQYVEDISLVAHDDHCGEPEPATEADTNPGTAALESAAPHAPAAADDRPVEAAGSPVNPPAPPADRNESLTDTMTAVAAGRAEAPPPATGATVTSPGNRRYTIHPRPPVIVDGFDVQTWHWIRCGAHSAALRIQKLALSGARGRPAQVETFRILNDEHHLLAERMEPTGATDDAIWRAIGEMDFRICELNAEARERGVPLDVMSRPDDPPAPIPPPPDGRAWRAAA